MTLQIIECPQFTQEFCEEIVGAFDTFENKRFTDRSAGNTLYRTIDRVKASYRSMVNLDIPKALREKLILAAPKCGSFLEEVIVNKYDQGDYIPKHIDSHSYLKFCVVPLVENGDGFSAYFDGPKGDESFYEDVLGTGILVTGNKLVHEVKPVKNKRYVILYLYL